MTKAKATENPRGIVVLPTPKQSRTWLVAIQLCGMKQEDFIKAAVDEKASRVLAR